MLKTVSILIQGKVQGVWYRQSSKEKALSLGIGGSVSNQPDGSVSITATGTAEQLNEFIAWCRQGPPRALVIHVDVKELPQQIFEGFEIRR
jgi:acylphosphatase